nr:LPXTG cell wall anchor domain-containing protein [Eubacterium sp.]
IFDAMYKSIVSKDESFVDTTVDKATELYDVEFQASFDGGVTWVTVTDENFPADGLWVVIPYPAGSDKEKNDFVVAHMFTHNRGSIKAGDIETPEVTKTDKGLKFKVSGLSPIYVSWIPVKTDDAKTVDAKDNTDDKSEASVDLKGDSVDNQSASPDNGQVDSKPADIKPADQKADSNGKAEEAASGDKAPKTGDETPIAGMGAMMLGSLLAVVYVVFKKRKQNMK